MRPADLVVPLGVVVRKSPGVTRWARWAWKAVAVLPGAPPAQWRELRREGEAVEFHATTRPLEFHRSDAEAYRSGLSARVPSIGVVMVEGEDGLTVTHVTASPYETQDFLDSGEEIVELVPMPDGLIALIRDFVDTHIEEERFVKRRRDRAEVDLREDGVGDARVRQTADVYRSPSSIKRRILQ